MDALLELVKGQGPLVGVLSMFIVALVKEWIVPGPAFQAMRQDRDRWQAAYMEIVEKMQAVSERFVAQLERRAGP